MGAKYKLYVGKNCIAWILKYLSNVYTFGVVWQLPSFQNQLLCNRLSLGVIAHFSILERNTL